MQEVIASQPIGRKTSSWLTVYDTPKTILAINSSSRILSGCRRTTHVCNLTCTFTTVCRDFEIS